MDIGLLSQMLTQLLRSHEEVALPGLGTLVTEFMPATFSDKGYTLNPPYKKLSFRQREAGGDSLLVETYARANALERREAEHIVNAFLSDVKDKLKEEKLVTLPGLGRLRATRENHFFFVMDEDADVFPDGFGLEPIHIKALSNIPDIKRKTAEQQEEMPEVQAESLPSSSTTENDKPRRRIGAFWTVLLVLLSVAVLALGVFAVLGRVAPSLVDQFLYTAEELEILNS